MHSALVKCTVKISEKKMYLKVAQAVGVMGIVKNNKNNKSNKSNKNQ